MKLKVHGLDKNLTQKFVSFCCAELQIAPNVLEIAGYPSDEDMHLKSGMCIDINEDEFLIIVATKNKNITQIYTTVAHELVHVKQYMYEDLGRKLDACGEEYKDRWWEKEATNMSKKLMLKFVHLFKQNPD